MTVYADVLMLVNFVVDYFLLLISSHFLQKKPRLYRMILSSAIGGVFSLYIFLPKTNFLINCSAQILACALMCLTAFGFGKIKSFFRGVAVLFCVNFAYSGAMIAVWLIFKPYGMVINNSVVYFNISPMILIICTVVGYILLSVLWRIFSRSAKLALRCAITVFANGKSVRLTAIADTGNSLEDSFGKSEVIIADLLSVKVLFGNLEVENNVGLKRRYQILPCSTVLGDSFLESFRCDSAIVECDGKKITLAKPLLAISKTGFNDDYNAIINPKILR